MTSWRSIMGTFSRLPKIWRRTVAQQVHDLALLGSVLGGHLQTRHEDQTISKQYYISARKSSSISDCQWSERLSKADNVQTKSQKLQIFQISKFQSLCMKCQTIEAGRVSRTNQTRSKMHLPEYSLISGLSRLSLYLGLDISDITDTGRTAFSIVMEFSRQNVWGILDTMVDSTMRLYDVYSWATAPNHTGATEEGASRSDWKVLWLWISMSTWHRRPQGNFLPALKSFLSFLFPSNSGHS